MPLCMHFGSGGAPSASEDAPFAVSIALFGMNSQYTTTELLFLPGLSQVPRTQGLPFRGRHRVDPVCA